MTTDRDILNLDTRPLHSVDAEEALIGWVAVLKGIRLRKIVEQIQPDMFFLATHRQIWPFMRDIATREGVVDLVALKAKLTSAGLMDDSSALEILSRIAAGSVWTSSSVEAVLHEVRSLWRLRLIESTGRQMQTLARSDLDPQEIVSKSQKLMADAVAGHGRPMLDLAEIDIDIESESGVPSGFESIDRLTSWLGFVTGQTSVVAAYHKGGKTAFKLQCAKFLLDKGRNVVYATFADLSAPQLKRRLLKQMCGLSKAPNQEGLLDQNRWGQAMDFLNDRLKDGSLLVYVGSEHGRYVEDLYAKVLEQEAEAGVDAVFVDYAQKLKSREKGARENKTAEIEAASDVLKSMAEDAKCSVIVGSQITRGERKGEIMTKYARAIEEDAGLVLYIGERDEQDRVTITAAYNRFGPSGVDVDFRWDPKRVRFEEVTA